MQDGHIICSSIIVLRPLWCSIAPSDAILFLLIACLYTFQVDSPSSNDLFWIYIYNLKDHKNYDTVCLHVSHR